MTDDDNRFTLTAEEADAIVHMVEVHQSVHDADERLDQASQSGDPTEIHRAVRNSIAAKTRLAVLAASDTDHNGRTGGPPNPYSAEAVAEVVRKRITGR